MLSRVADCLYWMSRYLERAEHTARLLDVNLDQRLDQSPATAERRWDRLLVSLAIPSPAEGMGDAYSITETLTCNLTNSASIASCIMAARENARQVREQVNSEMWEQLNRLFLTVRQTSMEGLWQSGPHEFLQAVKEGAHLFQGITDATMSHGEGWQFIQIGRCIERASTTAMLLDAYARTLFDPARLPRHADGEGEDGPIGAAPDYLEWVGLLKSCTAFEAYCKVYTATIQPERVAEFLLLNAEFPRSIRFTAAATQAALQAVARLAGRHSAGRAERLAGRLRASLDYAQVDEILAEGIESYLRSIRTQCVGIHDAIYQTYLAYPVDAALVS